ncbi:hypothetical protein HPB47_017324, partial [Ixodes persulcatus]
VSLYEKGDFVCGGTLISDHLVLTAAHLTAGNKDSTNSSEPSDLAGNSDPTDARRGQAQYAKRVISSSGSRSPRSRDKSGRRPKKPRPSSRDTSFSSAEDV